jgi:hypothetical protein
MVVFALRPSCCERGVYVCLLFVLSCSVVREAPQLACAALRLYSLEGVSMCLCCGYCGAVCEFVFGNVIFLLCACVLCGTGCVVLLIAVLCCVLCCTMCVRGAVRCVCAECARCAVGAVCCVPP